MDLPSRRTRKHALWTVVITAAGGFAAGCGGAPVSPRTRPPEQKSELHAVAAATLSEEADRARKQLVQEELDRYARRELTFSAAELSPQDQRLLQTLLEAAAVVEELNLLQGSARMLEYRKQVLAKGTSRDQQLFRRNHGPWCLGTQDVRCNALRTMPPRPAGVTAWPDDLTATELEGLRQRDDAATLLSPFTLVQRERGKKLVAVAPVDHPLLGPRVKRLAALLRRAADQTGERTLQVFLRSRATALVSRDPLPYEDSDLDWIRLEGPWEVTVGPYETYTDPWGIKARFAIYIGRLDPKVTARLTRYRQRLQRMERRLARLVGKRLYRARTIDPRSPIRAVNVIKAAGDARSPKGALVSYTLPNVGRAVKQGLSKKVILVNHIAAYAPVARARAEAVLTAEQVPYVTEEAGVLNSTFHEFCHSFGPHDELEIADPQGKKVTVARALGPHAAVLGEVKAEAFGLWLVSKQRDVSRKQLRERYTTAVIQLLGLLRNDLRGAHTRAAAIVLAAIMQDGGLRYSERDNKFTINYRRMRRALRTLSKRVATVQLKGDRAGAGKLIRRYLRETSGGYRLVDAVDRPRLKAAEAFLDAGIKGIVLSYKVTDLSPPPAPPGDRPGKDRPGKPEPGKDRPGKPEPGKDRPGKPEPGKDRPGKPEPGKDRPGKPEPGKPEPGKDRPAQTQPGQAGKDRPRKTSRPKKDGKNRPEQARPRRDGERNNSKR